MKEVRVLVDRMHVGMVFEDKDDANLVATREWVRSVFHKDFDKPGKVWSSSKGYSLTNASQPLSYGDLFVRYGYHTKKLRAWYQFNPDKVDLVELGVHFNLMLSNGFKTLYSTGIATKTEIAIDIDGASYKNYCFIDTVLRTSDCRFQTAGTLYVGSEFGNRSVICYDKRKEMLETTGEDIGHERLRIETQLRGANKFPLSAIAGVENPFRPIVMIDRKKLASSPMSAAAVFRKRLQICQDAQAAFSTLSKSERTATRIALLQLQPSYWNPDKIWKEFPESLHWVDTLCFQC